MNKAILLFVFAVVVVVVCSAQDKPYNCEANITSHGSVYRFNLLPLYHNSTTNDVLSFMFDQGLMFFNFCGPTTTKCSIPGSSMCLRTQDWTYLSSGLLQTQEVSGCPSSSEDPDKIFSVRYTSGDSTGCPATQSRQVTVYVHCNPLANPGFFDGPARVNGCHYTFNLYSIAGCGMKIH